TAISDFAMAQSASRPIARIIALWPTWPRGLPAGMASASRMGVALRSPAYFLLPVPRARRRPSRQRTTARLIAKRAHADHTHLSARRVGAAVRIAARADPWRGRGRRRRGARPGLTRISEWRTEPPNSGALGRPDRPII